MTTRLFLIDHKRGNRCNEGRDAHSHLFRAVVWVARPAGVPDVGPLKIHLLSRETGAHRGWIMSNVEGAFCAGCEGKKEPLTHVADEHVTEADRAALRAGTLYEFVIDDFGGQIPDSFDDEAVRAHLASFVTEVEVAFADAIDRALNPKRALVGTHIDLSGAR